MSRRARSALPLLAGTLVVAALALAPAAAFANGFERVAIQAAGTATPAVALTAEIPAGWRTRGGVQWNEQAPCITNALRFDWQASSPDGLRQVELLPGFNWQVRGHAIQMNPCPVAPIGSVEQFLRGLVAELYPGAAVTGYRDLSSQAAQPQPMRAGHRPWAEAGRIEIAYAMRGVEIRETLQAAANFSEMGPSRVAGVPLVFVVRAPKNAFDETLGERVSKSLVPNQPWFEQMNQRAMQLLNARSAAQRAEIDRWHNARMAEISAKGMADRAAIRSQTMREIGEINTAGWKSRMASMDRMHRDNVDTIREVNRYRDPTTNRQVELSSHYNHGFRTANGGYVATDNPNFNPGAGGFEMQRVR